MIILSRITATLFDDNLVVIVLLTFTGLSLLLFFAWKIRNRYIELQRTLHGGWTRFAVVSALFYLMIYVIISYPSPLNQRREYIPAVILFCVIVITVYGVIIQTLMKSVTIYNEQRENELLETKLALQNSQLELKEIYYIMAYTDAMTGLKNRAAFEERKKKLSENPVGLSCLMLDLNNLKTTNDIYGHAFSVEQPANTFAMEFADGKLMFGDSGSLARIDYSLICERTGRAELAERIDKSSLFCFTNWSGLLHSNDILAGILREICP